MWDFLKAAGKEVLKAGAAYLGHRAFITQLFSMTEEQAVLALRKRVFEMDEEEYRSFSFVLGTMIGEAQRAVNQAETTPDRSWGGSIEDQIAQGIAHVQSGVPSQSQNTQAHAYLQSLILAGNLAEQFNQQKMAQNSSGESDMSEKSKNTDPQELLSRLKAGLQKGDLDPELLEQLSSMNISDGDALDELREGMEAMDTNEGVASVRAADFYRPGTEKFTLKWELDGSIPLTEPFDDLDAELQFHILFSEYQRREIEGQTALIAGNNDTAKAIFEECLERADQLQVNELRARTFEDLRQLAKKVGDRAAARQWLDAAEEARGMG